MSLLRTDLAVESAAQYQSNLPNGVTVEELDCAGTKLTRVVITNDDAAQKLGRAQGKYVTIELPSVAGSVDPSDDVTHLLAKELAGMLPAQGAVLVVGLGNEQITPDALGPQAAHQIFATRHIPAQVAEQTSLTGLRPVASIAPGVLGQTGIETGEIIRSIVRDLQPAAVIVIDAFASSSLERLGRTVQLADCGISPGSGVLNARKELSRSSLGVPVVSIGIPTVVDSGTLACELLGCEDEQKVAPEARAMMVTPRDIDAIIKRGAKHLSLAINSALQPQLSLEDITYLVS
ncbi:GPR endopeptidase [Oscillospiraceae bacterium PP1C4]